MRPIKNAPIDTNTRNTGKIVPGFHRTRHPLHRKGHKTTPSQEQDLPPPTPSPHANPAKYPYSHQTYPTETTDNRQGAYASPNQDQTQSRQTGEDPHQQSAQKTEGNTTPLPHHTPQTRAATTQHAARQHHEHQAQHPQPLTQKTAQ